MTTAAARASERLRLVRLALALGGVERVVSSVVSALRVSILVWALGARGYGVYVAILGIVGTANLLDFGLHYAVVSSVSHASGRDDRAAVKEIVATAFTIYSLVTLTALLLIVPAAMFAPLGDLLHLEGGELVDARWVAGIGFAGLLCSMPLKVIPAGLIGLQQQHRVSAFRSASALLGLGVLAAAAIVWPGRLVRIVALTSTFDFLAGAGFCVWVTLGSEELSFGPRSVRRQRISALLGSGATFFVTGLANVFKRSLGATVIAHTAGPEAVPTFHVPLMLFTLGLGFVELLVGSLWPAYGEAFARSDWSWIRRAFTRVSKLGLLLGLLIAVLGVWFGDEVISLWTAKVLPPSASMLAWMGVWMIAQVVATIGATLLNGLGRNRIVMWTMLVEGTLSFGIGLVAAQRFGAVGVAAAMALAAIGSAAFLFGPAVRMASNGEVHARPDTPLLACAIGAALVGGAIDRGLQGTPTIVRLSVGAVVTTAAYSAVAWHFALDAAERNRLKAWVTTRWGAARAAERP